mmetsp:Transcript_8521/g.28063  ORF Transcript_8521/g.28063 Transcript_8521/m.28063 type:complete len:226 (-) Transcript_8521:156-833(-)
MRLSRRVGQPSLDQCRGRGFHSKPEPLACGSHASRPGGSDTGGEGQGVQGGGRVLRRGDGMARRDGRVLVVSARQGRDLAAGSAAAAAAAAPPPPATTRASACAAVTSLVASSLCHSYHSTTSISAVESVIPQGGLANGQGKPPPAADADASTRRGERAPRAREQRKPMHATSRNAPREANPLPPSIHSAAAAYRLRVRTRSVPTAPDRSVGEGGEAAGAGAAAA